MAEPIKHKLSPVYCATDDRQAVSCICGFEVISKDAREVMAIASAHANPDLAEVVWDFYSRKS